MKRLKATMILVPVYLFLCIGFFILESNSATMPTSCVSVSKNKLDLRLPLAGGIAGAIASGLLLPIDTFKTMRQTDRSIPTIKAALERLRSKGFAKMYSGLVPAVVGSFPSSAVYFGAYEWAKVAYASALGHILNRQAISMLAAATGNILSSAIFVPKDVLKQRIQAIRTGAIAWSKPLPPTSDNVLRDLLSQKGLGGLYAGYYATILRNIPSAVVRFTLYEELKYLIAERAPDSKMKSFGYLVAGALASGFSSGLTTPLDVVKTRMATGLISPGTSVLTAVVDIATREGYRGLYAGYKARVTWSALYGGIGLFLFEKSKDMLGVDRISMSNS